MALVFSSPFVRLYSNLIYLSSLYSPGTLIYFQNYASTNFSLELLCHDMVILPKRCSGFGLVFMHVIALYQLQRCRVIFSNVGEVLRLLNIIKWVFTPWSNRV